jgi:hypothetical protein
MKVERYSLDDIVECFIPTLREFKREVIRSSISTYSIRSTGGIQPKKYGGRSYEKPFNGETIKSCLEIEVDPKNYSGKVVVYLPLDKPGELVEKIYRGNEISYFTLMYKLDTKKAEELELIKNVEGFPNVRTTSFKCFNTMGVYKDKKPVPRNPILSYDRKEIISPIGFNDDKVIFKNSFNKEEKALPVGTFGVMVDNIIIPSNSSLFLPQVSYGTRKDPENKPISCEEIYTALIQKKIEKTKLC